MPTDERYPLWCVDFGLDAEPDRYYGPYHSEEGAQGQVKRLVQEGHKVELRRCRHLRFSELFPCAGDDLADQYDHALAEGEGERPGKEWANWEDKLIEPELSGFQIWADKNLVMRVFICEGDEEVSGE